MAYLYTALFCWGDGLDGAGRADFRTLGAFWPAITTVVLHVWLHQRPEVRRWTEYSVRTVRHTQLATGAVLCEELGAKASGWKNRGLADGYFFIKNGCQTSVYLFVFLCFCQACGK